MDWSTATSINVWLETFLEQVGGILLEFEKLMTRGEEGLTPAAYSQTGDSDSISFTGYSLTRNSQVISPRAHEQTEEREEN